MKLFLALEQETGIFLLDLLKEEALAERGACRASRGAVSWEGRLRGTRGRPLPGLWSDFSLQLIPPVRRSQNAFLVQPRSPCVGWVLYWAC